MDKATALKALNENQGLLQGNPGVQYLKDYLEACLESVREQLIVTEDDVHIHRLQGQARAFKQILKTIP